jgi:hypothetical protein
VRQIATRLWAERQVAAVEPPKNKGGRPKGAKTKRPPAAAPDGKLPGQTTIPGAGPTVAADGSVWP